MAMTTPHTRMQVRLPAEVYDWISKRSEYYGTSINSTIIRLCRDEMEREAKAAERAAKTKGANHVA